MTGLRPLSAVAAIVAAAGCTTPAPTAPATPAPAAAPASDPAPAASAAPAEPAAPAPGPAVEAPAAPAAPLPEATRPSADLTTPPQPASRPFRLTRVSYDVVPGWPTGDHAPALSAFRRHCAALAPRAPSAPMGGQYGGVLRDWQPACTAALSDASLSSPRQFFETWFYPARVSGPGDVKLTGYFEPVIATRRQPEPGFTEPLLRKPADLITINLAAFAEAYDNDILRGAPRLLSGRLAGGSIEPYPKRGDLKPQPGQVIAWAHPVDVYNLQVQGSGRIQFPDGVEMRAQFAAQNGYRWNSALGALRGAGEIAAASWSHFRDWVDRNPARGGEALKADPSYVFFQDEAITDPTAGPRGAANVPLTAYGSMAIDPAWHPYGALIFVDGQFDGQPFRRLLAAQDTGGAIRRGPLRGDVFFGSGPVAGAHAERMNAPAVFYTLIPRTLADPMAGSGLVLRR